MPQSRDRFRTARVLQLPILGPVALLLCLSIAGRGNGQEVKKVGLPPAWLDSLKWRCIGPAGVGGRVSSMAVFEADPTTYYIGTASGGLVKTINNGVTFEHCFDRETSVSIGDVAVAPSDRNIVWVGTGENNPRNSVSFGDGVYKSTDGGKTWKNMGLRKSFQIGRIAIHPTNPDIVYVGALGRLYGPNEERGLYKTSDGGVTWEKVLSIDDRTGIVEVKMNPADPDELIVAAWERRRDEFDSWVGKPEPPETFTQYEPVVRWGRNSGLFKTSDGGKTFRKLTKGLPTSPLGRMGLDYFRKDPRIIFAIVDCEEIGKGKAPTPPGFLGVSAEDSEMGVRISKISPKSPADSAGVKVGDLVLSLNGTKTPSTRDFDRALRSHLPGSKLPLRVVRDGKTIETTATLDPSPPVTDPYANFPYTCYLGGQEENAQDRQTPDGWQYGGVYKSSDGGESWQRVNTLNPRPYYFSQIRVDPSNAELVYVLGASLFRSKDGGKVFTDDGADSVFVDHHAFWINPRDGRHMLTGSDGGFYVTYDRGEKWAHFNQVAIGQFYHVSADSAKPYRVLGGLQDGGCWIGPSRTLGALGPNNGDWTMIGHGDGFVCRSEPGDPAVVYYEAQNGNLGRRNLRTGEHVSLRPQAPPGKEYRFNWNTPYHLSPHNEKTLYLAGNYVFRSANRGDNLQPISPEITRTPRGSGTALAESPLDPDVLWVGSDDGALWITRNAGKTWTSVIDAIPLPGPRWVASIEASRSAAGRAYVCFDGHRSNDDAPYLFVTDDFGKTWRSLTAGLPAVSTRVLREDVKNPNLLYLGTEFAAWLSIDRGTTWQRLNTNLPTVAVHEFAMPASSSEIVAATHGRSLWALDVNVLRQMSPALAQTPVHLFNPAPALRWRIEPNRGTLFGAGDQHFHADNPPRGATLTYHLLAQAKSSRLRIFDALGHLIKDASVKTTPGIHTWQWNLLGKDARAKADSPETPMPPGRYRVVLTVDGVEKSAALTIEPDPAIPEAIVLPDDDFFQAIPSRARFRFR